MCDKKNVYMEEKKNLFWVEWNWKSIKNEIYDIGWIDGNAYRGLSSVRRNVALSYIFFIQTHTRRDVYIKHII